jgi:L-alanine-DL-glutamate epimerase-like enolase superfamily enzyme
LTGSGTGRPICLAKKKDPAMPELTVRHESWPLAKAFAISRDAKTTADIVVAALSGDGVVGRGECVPYTHYGESVADTVAALELLAPAFAADRMDRLLLQEAIPPGAARNALDCALWDFEAKRSGVPVWRLAGLEEPGVVTTAYTLGLDTPEAMGRAARAESHRPLIKLKLAGDGDLDRVAAVRRNAPTARLIVDANEGWAPDQVEPLAIALARLGVEMIEQPLPADGDAMLSEIAHPIPFCADESCHDRGSLAALAGRYDVVNIKLDKTGGLTEALALRRAAEAMGLRVMVGCMVATSLAMAPATLLAQGAEIVDLDGPLLLACDRENSITYKASSVSPPVAALWG